MSHKKRMTGKYQSVDSYQNGTLMRRCSFCNKVKPITEFALNGSGKRRTDCKTCYNIRRKENRHKKSFSDFCGSMKRRNGEVPELTFQEWKEAIIFFGGTCAYCGSTIRRNEKLTKDHVVPISKGGTTTPDNIIPACARCNSSKGQEELKTWYMKQPFFSQERLNRIYLWRTIQRMLKQTREGEISNDE